MKKFLSIFLLVFTGVVAFAQTNFDPKSLLSARTGNPTLVNDFSNVLTADQKQTLESKLIAFDDSTSSQIAVVIIPSLGDYDISDYSVKLGRAWGVGGKQFNNGVVVIICNDPNNHKSWIATGYGMEGALPDVTCKEILEDVVNPSLRGNDYYKALNEGTDAIIQATKGEYTAPAGYNQNYDGSGGKIILIIFFIIIAISILSRIGGGGGSGGIFNRSGFLPFIIGNMLGGGGFGGGGGSSGGGGGGFGGFGGGSFGGGGAGGSW